MLEVLKKGEVVEGYRIISELGRGAASIIYLVIDEKTKQVWALKDVQKINDKSERFMAQAESEYKIAQKFSHEAIRNIPKLIKKKKGLRLNRLFLIMEHVDGKSMDDSNVKPTTFERACEVFKQAGAAMHHMHEQGYVHADFKPHNVIVDGTNHVKIIDLGQSCQMTGHPAL